MAYVVRGAVCECSGGVGWEIESGRGKEDARRVARYNRDAPNARAGASASLGDNIGSIQLNVSRRIA